MINCYEIYKDTAGEYRWRYWSNNGNKIADSAEGYIQKSDCQRGIDIMKATNANTPVKDSTFSQNAVRY